MHLLVIAPSLRNTSPGSRFRVEQWIPHFEAEGISCTYAAFEDAELHGLIYTPGNYVAKAQSMLRALRRRLSLLDELPKFDVVFLYEEAARIGPALLERLIRRRGIPLVYDFCDPIFLPYLSPRNRHFARLKCFGKTATICRIADHVLVGNEDLASYALRYNSRVSVVPITIDTREYPVKPTTRASEDVPVIGWTGSHSTVAHLDGVRDALRELATMRRFRLEVIGTMSYEIDGVDVVARPWSAESEVSDLHRFDIGIMPLPDDSWTRLRTHLKVRQYMGVGLPAVVSPVGVIAKLVADGVNGFLASSREEWVAKLKRLVDDPALRVSIGRRARATIEQDYDGERWARRVSEILRAVSGSRRERRSA